MGKDITLGEYIEKVYPELLKDVPEDIEKRLYSTKIVWPNEKTENSVIEKARLNKSDTKTKDVITRYDKSELWLDPEWPHLKHTLWSKMFIHGNINAETTYTASYEVYWRVTGHRWRDYPPGYNPSDYDSVTDTGWGSCWSLVQRL